jgi:SAM-dependent methyltransferase
MSQEAADFHWGTDAVDLSEKSLPALKARFLVDHVPEAGRVMEIGCGGGKLLRTLKQHRPGLELFGCDIRSPREAPEGFAFRAVSTSGKLPFDDGALDAVLIFDVLEHVPDPDATLTEAARVLRPKGRLVAFVPIEGEMLSLYTVFRAVLGQDVYAETKEHIQAFTHEGLIERVTRRFEIVEKRYAYHALGHIMDASFFAAHKLKKLREMFWRENVYYNAEKKKESGTAARVFNGLLQLGNAAAYGESTLFSTTRATSAGVLLEARRR